MTHSIKIWFTVNMPKHAEGWVFKWDEKPQPNKTLLTFFLELTQKHLITTWVIVFFKNLEYVNRNKPTNL